MIGLNVIFLLGVKLVRLTMQWFINTDYALNGHFGHSAIVFVSLGFKATDPKPKASQKPVLLPLRWTIFCCGTEKRRRQDMGDEGGWPCQGCQHHLDQLPALLLRQSRQQGCGHFATTPRLWLKARACALGESCRDWCPPEPSTVTQEVKGSIVCGSCRKVPFGVSAKQRDSWLLQVQCTN